ncbi:hypothetical protein VNI00_004038 [Paramarasmius palmivorus]|uniref:Uncharacterized protein n=1 Tax=Paramarasmius palmivorus TaxID=297713 RepID=A0AAW0DKW3_9AGAR
MSSASSSSSSSSSSLKSRKRRFTRQQLLKHLEILNTLPTPPPYTLPPSPPASRESSPALPSKRKCEPAIDSDRPKRPRTGSVSERHPPAQRNPHLHSSQPSSSHVPVSHHPVPYNPRSEPTEDGEVAEDPIAAPSMPQAPHPTASSSIIASQVSESIASAVPIRRPRKGPSAPRWFEQLHDKYHSAGRKLKYSGDARFWSTYPPTHKEYRALPDPPPPNSPYHKFGGLIARLELLDALVCFTYSLWCRDHSRRSCNPQTWSTIEAFLDWCKTKWASEEGINDAEKAFCGLIWMIEGFIHARKVAYGARSCLEDVDRVVATARKDIQASISEAAIGSNTALLGGKPQATPPMLPSPASIVPTNSANSTPTNNGTPSSSGTRSASASSASEPPAQSVGPSVPPRLLPQPYSQGALVPPHITMAANKVTVPITPQLIGAFKDQTAGIHAAANSMREAQTTLTLPIMARFFPRTFARMIHTTLSPTDEHEPEFEDEEGELFWPGQAVSGEGLGWVCLMGQAMIREFGKTYGYKGLQGVVPKPEQTDGRARSTQRTAPHGSTPASVSGQR